MTASIEIKKSGHLFTLQDVEDLCQRARGAGALGVETFHIHVSPGGMPWESDYTSMSVRIED